MNLNKRSSRIVLWLLLALSSAQLIACGQQSASGSSIDTPEQAQEWLNQQKLSAHNSPTGVPNAPSPISDRRLLHSDAQASSPVFIAMDPNPVGAPKNKLSDGTNAHDNSDALAVKELLISQAQMSTAHTEPKAPVAIDLAQANAAQMKFVGVIQNENQYFGLVQVGERVYRVQQNEAIGSGKWRVAAIDETRMQLVVNGKLVTYDK